MSDDVYDRFKERVEAKDTANLPEDLLDAVLVSWTEARSVSKPVTTAKRTPEGAPVKKTTAKKTTKKK